MVCRKDISRSYKVFREANKIREKLGLDLKSFAKSLGVPPYKVYAWNGAKRRDVPDAEILQAWIDKNKWVEVKKLCYNELVEELDRVRNNLVECEARNKELMLTIGEIARALSPEDVSSNFSKILECASEG